MHFLRLIHDLRVNYSFQLITATASNVCYMVRHVFALSLYCCLFQCFPPTGWTELEADVTFRLMPDIR